MLSLSLKDDFYSLRLCFESSITTIENEPCIGCGPQTPEVRGDEISNFQPQLVKTWSDKLGGILGEDLWVIL